MLIILIFLKYLNRDNISEEEYNKIKHEVYTKYFGLKYRVGLSGRYFYYR